MKQHPREEIVQIARVKVMDCFAGIREELTTPEFLQVISLECGYAIRNTAKFMIRMERHGDIDKPGAVCFDDDSPIPNGNVRCFNCGEELTMVDEDESGEDEDNATA